MDIEFSEEDHRFREEARGWLKANVPSKARPDDGPAAREFDLAWQRTQYEAGWAGISWSTEYGGKGLSLLQQMIWYEEYSRAGGPYVGICFVGLNHAGPTLIAKGTDDQKAKHLPPILKGEVVWCQGFSEPDAGSDLASLKTRATIEGDELVVTGQKVWSSAADVSDYQELLVRTDPAVPKHRGLTWVICDMGSPGITVRPIRTMAGILHFCEVFYDEVRIPLENVVGEINDGWNVGLTTLDVERGTGTMADQVVLAFTVEKLIALAREVPSPDNLKLAIEDDELFRRLAVCRAEAAGLRALTYATISRIRRTGKLGPAGSIVRLYYSELLQRVHLLAMDILGVDGLRTDLQYQDTYWSVDYARSFSSTIAAGSKDIQRNLIGERLLGLPR